MMAPPKNIVMNPSGIGVPGAPGSQSETENKPGQGKPNPTFQSKPKDDDEGGEEGEGGDFSLPVEDKNPPKREEEAESSAKQQGQKKRAKLKQQLIAGIAGVVLLAGLVAAADMFLLGGKLFGLGAKATGPYRYHPDSPQLVVDINVQEVLFNPVVAIKLDEAGGIGMVDQMMQSAVGLGPYDIKEVKIIASGLTPNTPEFVCIITAAKKIPEQMLVEKFFGNDKPERIGGRNVYDLPMPMNGKFVACVADEMTFLLGDRKSIESVLSRKADPEFSAKELTLIETTEDSDALVSSSFNFGLVQLLGQSAQEGPNKLVYDLLVEPGSAGSARMLGLEAGIGAYEDGSGDTLEFDYRLGFDSGASASTTLKAIKERFEIMELEEFGPMLGIRDAKVVTDIATRYLQTVEFSQDGAAVVMHIAVPVDFYTQLLLQDMGSIPGL